MAEPVEAFITGAVVATAEKANLSRLRAERSVADTTRLIAEVADDEAFLNDIAADLGKKRISRAEWINMRGPVEERLRENRARLARVTDGDRLPDDLVTIDRERFEALTVDQKRAVVGLFIEKVICDPAGRNAGPKFNPARLRVAWKA